jgi:hypothetical protein
MTGRNEWRRCRGAHRFVHLGRALPVAAFADERPLDLLRIADCPRARGEGANLLDLCEVGLAQHGSPFDDTRCAWAGGKRVCKLGFDRFARVADRARSSGRRAFGAGVLGAPE